MCGIAGLVSPGRARKRLHAVNLMTDSLHRRGPDAKGTWAWTDAALGHRRLAIMDLSDRGLQPLLSEDASAGVVFNGAIYNFRELRLQLEKLGYRFRSTTDTEVLVHGYREWGIEQLVARLRGMFAFALWDERTCELYLVRDRLGVKPLVYSRSGNELAFASTADALRSAGFGRELDEQAVADYLEWGFVPDQRSIHRGIDKLPPASILHWRNGEIRRWSYWSPPRSATASVSFPEAVEESERLLLAAVERRTYSDVPIGVLLSGGIDSALVCWALRECGADVRAFTFAAPGHREDESEAALLTANELGIHVNVLEAPSSVDEWSQLGSAYAEPFACGSALGMLRLSQAVRRSATVLLTGDGGDDVFLGYPQHQYLLRAQRLARWVPNAAARMWAAAGQMPPVSGFGRRGRQFAGYTTGGLAAFLKVRGTYRFLETSGLLGPRLRHVRPASQSLPVVPGAGRTVLDDYLDYDLHHQFVAEYLTKVDGATMHHGLEARSPFLDQDLWEFAASLPYGIRLHGNQSKAVLRAIARRRISPRVAAAGKRGFEVPVGAWLRDRWSDDVRRLVGTGVLPRGGWIDSDRLWSGFQRGSVPADVAWNALVFAQWLNARDPSLATLSSRPGVSADTSTTVHPTAAES